MSTLSLRVPSGFQATMQLRFIRRVSREFPGETGYKYILQQKWKARDGRAKWVDVPRFDPFKDKEDEDVGVPGQG